MKVSDILRVKGNTLYTISPNETLGHATAIMAESDVGSLAVMEKGELVGMLTFREVLLTVANNDGSVGNATVRSVMLTDPPFCTSSTELEKVRPMMLNRRSRYMPVIENKVLLGVISLYDVAKAIVDNQDFENKMLKAYIRDWPHESEEAAPSK